jgi:hypothetical protein
MALEWKTIYLADGRVLRVAFSGAKPVEVVQVVDPWIPDERIEGDDAS